MTEAGSSFGSQAWDVTFDVLRVVNLSILLYWLLHWLWFRFERGRIRRLLNRNHHASLISVDLLNKHETPKEHGKPRMYRVSYRYEDGRFDTSLCSISPFDGIHWFPDATPLGPPTASSQKLCPGCRAPIASNQDRCVQCS